MKDPAVNALCCDDSTQSSFTEPRVALVADVLRRDRKSKQTVRMRVTGESMLPALWPGDEVVIASCGLEDVTPGEIVLAERGGRLFLHRLVRAHEHGFVLRGDSVPKQDPEFEREALLGRLQSGKQQSSTRGARPQTIALLWIRAVGMLLSYCGPLRRFALRWHRRRAQSEFPGSSLEIV